MADEKREREQQPGGEQRPERQRSRNRKPIAGSMESPKSTPTLREDEQEPQE
jgi:hypothetical protein